MDPTSGYNSVTKTFHSLRPPLGLPPEDIPISATEFSLSLLSNLPSDLRFPNPTALIDSSSGQRLSYAEFTDRVHSLSSYLRHVTNLSKGDVAFFLSPNSIHIPVLYLALVSLGVVVSPGNPASTEQEISRLVSLSNPKIAFAKSATIDKLPPSLRQRAVLLDSPEYRSMVTWTPPPTTTEVEKPRVSQSDVAAILYSSGTTGKVKGVMLTQRNIMATVAVFVSGDNRAQGRGSQAVAIYTVPLFHVYGFFYAFKSVAKGEAIVVMERFELGRMLRAVEEFRVAYVATAPPVVVAMAKSDATEGYDLTSLDWVACGGAPLGKDVVAAFSAKFPSVELAQGYGLTETTGGISRSCCREESLRWGATGKLSSGCEAKIVDPETGEHQSPGQQGELWIRGPQVMKGYISDLEATAATLTPDGWLKTGDICYIDREGFLFVVDRLKEMIKCKGYQVAPAELEELLQSHPEIADAAVVGFPDDEAGEVPMAFVVRKRQSRINDRDIMEFVAKNVAPYNKIRRVAFVSSIPRSAAGKILRKKLRKMIVPSKM